MLAPLYQKCNRDASEFRRAIDQWWQETVKPLQAAANDVDAHENFVDLQFPMTNFV